MGGEAVFTSHPNKELLKIHDPEKFGCTPCHGGNGAAVSSVEKAHGYNKFWLWPMHHKENIEAGCQQCHAQGDRHRDGRHAERRAARFSACAAAWAAIATKASIAMPTRCPSVNQQIRQLEQQKAEWIREAGFSTEGRQDPRQRRSAEALRARQRFEGALPMASRNAGSNPEGRATLTAPDGAGQSEIAACAGVADAAIANTPAMT